MNAEAFWNVIGTYNSQTILVQLALFLFLAVALILSYSGKVAWIAKLALGILNLYIGIVFFAIYGTEDIQKFFALPLFVGCGILFILESIRSKEDALKKPTCWQAFLLLLYLLYPAVSLALGNSFPKLVTYIMPCPIISLSIAVYSGYAKKNKLLLALLAIWGLTGVKSVLFHAYEDLILFICGLYCVYLFFKERKRSMGQL